LKRQRASCGRLKDGDGTEGKKSAPKEVREKAGQAFAAAALGRSYRSDRGENLHVADTGVTKGEKKKSRKNAALSIKVAVVGKGGRRSNPVSEKGPRKNAFSGPGVAAQGIRRRGEHRIDVGGGARTGGGMEKGWITSLDPLFRTLLIESSLEEIREGQNAPKPSDNSASGGRRPDALIGKLLDWGGSEKKRKAIVTARQLS